MAGQIQITPETMRQRATQFHKQGEKINETITTMNNLLGTLESEWKGEAARAYSSRYTSELRPSFEEARDLVFKIERALNKTAQIQEDTDKRIAQGFTG